MKYSAAGLFLRCASTCCWAALSAGLAPPSWSDDASDGLVAGSGNAYLAQLEAVPPPAAPPLPQPPPGQAGPKEPGAPAQPGEAKPDATKPDQPKPWYTPITRWLDPKTAPFLPVPEIAVDPDSGTTLGLIPTILVTDENDDIRKIIAPDLIHNPYFGWGVHGRIYSYDSQDEQWSIVTGIQERVEREFDGEYQIGRERKDRWSFNGSLIYAVDGTPRFYGIGNESPAINQTDYTAQSELLQLQPGYNLSHAWQIQYTARFQNVDVLPGTLARIATIGSRFSNILGEGTNRNFLNRVSIVFDTRDDIIIPPRAPNWGLRGYGEPGRRVQRFTLYGDGFRRACVRSRAR